MPNRCLLARAALIGALLLAAVPVPSARAQAIEPPTTTVSAAAAALHNQRELERSLATVQVEREGTHLLLPWVVTAAGAAILVTGIVLGATASLDCDDSCSTSFWPGWLVIGGGTIGEVGMIWLLFKHKDIAELRSREHRLETELQHLRWNSPSPATSPQAAFTLRRTF